MPQIDIASVLRQKAPGLARRIPQFAIDWLRRTVREREINHILASYWDLPPQEFIRACFREWQVTYSAIGLDKLDPAGRYLFVANHPFGGMDGMMLADKLTERFGDARVVVNDLLMAVEPLRKVFVPVNTHGRQSRRGTAGIEDAFASDRPVIVFPAGLVSRKGKGGRIADLKWRKSFINLSVKYSRDIIPMYFDGTNSGTFYELARARERLGLKFNFEMIRLPREIMLSRGKKYTIHIGKRIPVSRLQGGRRADDETLAVRKIVYNLKKDN